MGPISETNSCDSLKRMPLALSGFRFQRVDGGTNGVDGAVAYTSDETDETDETIATHVSFNDSSCMTASGVNPKAS